MKKIFNRVKKFLLNEYFLLTVIILLGFGARLYEVTSPIADWHSWRQADTSSVSRIYVEKGIDILHPQYYDISSIQTGIPNPEGYRFVEFPIYNAIHALLATSLPILSLEVWGRVLSAFSSIVSVYFLYLIGKRLMGVWGGLLSAFFFAFIPFNIYFSRTILPEPMSIAFGLAGVYLFMKFIEKERKLLLFLSGVLLSAAILIKPFVIFYTVPLIYLLIKKYKFSGIFRNKKLLLNLGLFALVLIAPFLAWRAWMNQFPEGIPFFKWAFNGDRIRFKPSFWRWIFGERIGHLILGGWGLIPFVFGFIKPKAENFIRYFLLGMLLYVTTFATASVRHDYYQTFVIPAVALALASGSLYLWNTEYFNRTASRILLVFSLLVMFFTGFLQVREFYRINHPELMITGEAVDRLTPPDALIIAPYNGDTAFLYQTKRYGWPYVDRPLNELIEKGANYYVSVDFSDPRVEEFRGTYEIVEETPQYIIFNLFKPLI